MSGKKGMSWGKKPAYSRIIAQRVCELIELGHNIKEVCELEGSITPAVIYHWKRKQPQFAKMFNEAYQTFIQMKIDELEHVSTASLNELYPDMKLNLQMEARRTRIKALEFLIAKVAPMFNPEPVLSNKDKVDKQPVASPIKIVSFAAKTDTEIKSKKD